MMGLGPIYETQLDLVTHGKGGAEATTQVFGSGVWVIGRAHGSPRRLWGRSSIASRQKNGSGLGNLDFERPLRHPVREFK